VEGQGEGQQRPGSGGRGVGEARAAGEERRGAAVAQEMVGEGGGVGREKTERGRSWRLKTETCLQFSKNVGTPL
jgi:hypothetical protein